MSKPATARWSYDFKVSYLSSPFGLELACKKFDTTPEEIEKLVGRYSRGKRKGELRGAITWYKVVKGGWVKTGPYDFEQMRGQGFVAKPGVCFGFQLVHFEKLIKNHKLTVPGDTRHSDTAIDLIRSYLVTVDPDYRREEIIPDTIPTPLETTPVKPEETRLQALCAVFGWQGGTIHQAVEELCNRLDFRYTGLLMVNAVLAMSENEFNELIKPLKTPPA